MSQVTSISEVDDELRSEYNLRELLKGGVRGKYADRLRRDVNLVLLDPDVARAFPTDQAVNEALRLAMQLSRLAHVEPEPSTT